MREDVQPKRALAAPQAVVRLSIYISSWRVRLLISPFNAQSPRNLDIDQASRDQPNLLVYAAIAQGSANLGGDSIGWDIVPIAEDAYDPTPEGGMLVVFAT